MILIESSNVQRLNSSYLFNSSQSEPCSSTKILFDVKKKNILNICLKCLFQAMCLHKVLSLSPNNRLHQSLTWLNSKRNSLFPQFFKKLYSELFHSFCRKCCQSHNLKRAKIASYFGDGSILMVNCSKRCW